MEFFNSVAVRPFVSLHPGPNYVIKHNNVTLPTCHVETVTSVKTQSKIAKGKSRLDVAARIVTLTKRFDHITPIMFKLHWLPLNYHIHYCTSALMAWHQLTYLNFYTTIIVHVYFVLVLRIF